MICLFILILISIALATNECPTTHEVDSILEATLKNDLTLLKCFIEKGANLNFPRKNGDTPLK